MFPPVKPYTRSRSSGERTCRCRIEAGTFGYQFSDADIAGLNIPTGIPLYLKCTAHPEWEGSVISNAPGDDHPQLKAISHRTGITLVSMESMEMWHQVGFLADAFDIFREHGISVDLISTSESVSLLSAIFVASSLTSLRSHASTAIEPFTFDTLTRPFAFSG